MLQQNRSHLLSSIQNRCVGDLVVMPNYAQTDRMGTQGSVERGEGVLEGGGRAVCSLSGNRFVRPGIGCNNPSLCSLVKSVGVTLTNLAEWSQRAR